VDEILSQSVGPYKNALEERHDELTDPADLAEAGDARPRARRGDCLRQQDIVIEPQGGLEIALTELLAAAGSSCAIVPQLPPASTNSYPPLSSSSKLSSCCTPRSSTPRTRAYVTYRFGNDGQDVDGLRGSSKSARTSGRRGKSWTGSNTLVKPYRPITPGATKVHGTRPMPRREAPPLPKSGPSFEPSSGDESHRAQSRAVALDVRRAAPLAAGRDGVDSLVFYDTLPLVRSLSATAPSSRTWPCRFRLEPGPGGITALDDAVRWPRVYRELERLAGFGHATRCW